MRVNFSTLVLSALLSVTVAASSHHNQLRSVHGLQNGHHAHARSGKHLNILQARTNVAVGGKCGGDGECQTLHCHNNTCQQKFQLGQQGCFSDACCHGEGSCQGGKCAAPSSGNNNGGSSSSSGGGKSTSSGENGSSCSADTECKSTLCHSGKCTPQKPAGGECQRDQCCLDGNKCVSGKCAAPGKTLSSTSTSTATSSSASASSTASTSGENGSTCSADTQCKSTLCHNSKCTPQKPTGGECSRDQCCLNGGKCVSGKCAAPVLSVSSTSTATATSTSTSTSASASTSSASTTGSENGATCSADTDCKSTLCHNSKCSPQKPTGGECSRDQCCLNGGKCVSNKCAAPAPGLSSATVTASATSTASSTAVSSSSTSSSSGSSSTPTKQGSPDGATCSADGDCTSTLCHNSKCEAQKPVGGECHRDQCCLNGGKCVDSKCANTPSLTPSSPPQNSAPQAPATGSGGGEAEEDCEDDDAAPADDGEEDCDEEEDASPAPAAAGGDKKLVIAKKPTSDPKTKTVKTDSAPAAVVAAPVVPAAAVAASPAAGTQAGTALEQVSGSSLTFKSSSLGFVVAFAAIAVLA